MDFRLTAAPITVTIQAGTEMTFTASTEALFGPAQSVTVTASSPSPLLTITPSSTTVPLGGAAVFTLKSTLAPVGETITQFSVPLTATAGKTERTATLTVDVNQAFIYLPATNRDR